MCGGIPYYSEIVSSKGSRKGLIFLGLITAAIVWCGFDLYVPKTRDIRDFDPAEMARLDNDMWRSYYEKKPLKLYFQLAELLRSQYHFPFLKSHVVAFSASKAAFVFKEGKTRADYMKALPDLVEYFAAIRKISRTPFDPRQAAKLELEWWIIHRDRAHSKPGDLDRSLAKAAAAVYNLPADKMMDYGRFRADAMTLRDSKGSGISEKDWDKIGELLHESWTALWKALHNPALSSAPASARFLD